MNADFVISLRFDEEKTALASLFFCEKENFCKITGFVDNEYNNKNISAKQTN